MKWSWGTRGSHSSIATSKAFGVTYKRPCALNEIYRCIRAIPFSIKLVEDIYLLLQTREINMITGTPYQNRNINIVFYVISRFEIISLFSNSLEYYNTLQLTPEVNHHNLSRTNTHTHTYIYTHACSVLWRAQHDHLNISSNHLPLVL